MSVFPDTPTALLTRIASELSGEADEAAWTEFFELYEPAMRGFLERRGCGSAAEDVVQTVFGRLVKILREGQYDRSRGPFRSYLATLLHHEMVSVYRHEAARGAGVTEPLENHTLAVENDPAHGLEEDWERELHAAVLRHVFERTALSRQSKEVYADLESTEGDCVEVARRHGLKPAAVRQIKSRVSRLVKAFKKRFAVEG